MKSAHLLLLSVAAVTTNALHVIQWQDNMVLSKGGYIDLTNLNEANKISEREPAIAQQFIFNLVSSQILSDSFIILDEQLSKLRLRCARVPNQRRQAVQLLQIGDQPADLQPCSV